MTLTKYIQSDLELTVTLSAYTAVDVVGGLLEFDVYSASGGGILNSIMLIDEDNQSEAYTLYIFDDTPSTIADAANFAPTIVDMRKLIATISISSYTTINSIAYCYVDDINKVFGNLTKRVLYAYLVAVATPDYVNADALYMRWSVLTNG